MRRYVRGSPAERLAARLVPHGDCLEFDGYRDKKGYGRLGAGDGTKRVVLAHRLAYELAHGTVPDGLCVLHSCDNPPCCRPDHLFLGTRVDNNADMRAKGRASTAGQFQRTVPEDARQRVLELYEPRVFGYTRVAQAVGLPWGTVVGIVREHRLLHPVV